MEFFPTDAVNDQEVGPNTNGSFFKYVAADNKWILIPNADVYSEAEVDALIADFITQAETDALYSVLAHLHDDRYYTETEINANTYTRAQVDSLNHDHFPNPNGNAKEQHMTAAQISALHARLHAITNILDHSANNHKVFYSDGSGHIIELALGADGQVLTSTGAVTAPAFEAPGEGADNLGNHTASEDLKMATFAITGVGNVDGVDISALKTAYDGHIGNVGVHQDSIATVISCNGYGGFLYGVKYSNLFLVACSDINAYVVFTYYIRYSGTYSIQILYSTSISNAGKSAGGRIFCGDNTAPSLMTWDKLNGQAFNFPLGTADNLYRKTYGNVVLSSNSTIGVYCGKTDNADGATGNFKIHAIILKKV